MFLARGRELGIEIMPDGDEAPWKLDLRRHLVLSAFADQDLRTVSCGRCPNAMRG
jgi:hypothetical protein